MMPNTDDSEPPPPSRTRSILNLTSSTLFGIYSDTGYEATTPWGPGSQTPLDTGRRTPLSTSHLDIDNAWTQNRERRRSVVQSSLPRGSVKHSTTVKRRGGFKNYWAPLLVKNGALMGMGVSYGVLISHLHDRDQLTPVKVTGIPHHSPAYLLFWGVVAVVLGQALPWVDRLWEAEADNEETKEDGLGIVNADGSPRASRHKRSGSNNAAETRRGLWTPGWNDVVRTIGAFVGIAFAIRKLPWQSTLQLSLTLALSNPAIWYLLDGTPPGFVLSTTVALSGTALLLGVNPNPIPAPAHNPVATGANATLSKVTLPDSGALVAGLVSQESVGVATWIASVLFVSCVCFGNIGRRL